MDRIEERYSARTSRSRALADRARVAIAGGNTRSATWHEPYPLTIRSGDGPFLTDVDGNRYVDMLGNFTSLVHGHAYGPIVRAATEAIARSSAWPAGNESQLELAELLRQRVASVDSVRFCNSGTEAGMLALKLAKAATGREFIIKARTGYHGSYDGLETDERGRVGPLTLTGEYGDLNSFEELLKDHGDRVAAVIVEPVQGGGTFSGSPSFLRGLRSATENAGCLLIFDEVITFRLAEGGVQTIVRVDPDITMFGKIIGGGFPVGAVGGREAIMEHFDPSRPDALFHSGTFNGNPVTCAAGLVSVQELTAARISAMELAAQQLEAALTNKAGTLGIPFTVTRAGSLLTTFFESPVPVPPRERNDSEAMRLFHLACLGRGVMIATRGLIALSTVMSADVLGEAIEKMGLALDDVASGLGG